MTTTRPRIVMAMMALTLCMGPTTLSWAQSTQSIQPSTSTQAKNSDPLWNGALIGSGVGFASGFLGMAAFNAKATATGPIWYDEAVMGYTAAGILGAGIGAGVGAIIDAVRKPATASSSSRRRVDVSPTVSRHAKGALVTVRY